MCFGNSAIVAAPHEKWGETPVAYIVIKENRILDEETVIKHCRENLAGYKVIQEKKKRVYVSVYIMLYCFNSVLLKSSLLMHFQKQGKWIYYSLFFVDDLTKIYIFCNH
jgi:hypothetical protein